MPLPSEAAAVMVAVPAPTAVTTPLFTVATFSLLLLHVTALLVASSGFTVAVKVELPPTSRVRLVLSSVTEVTETVGGSVTVTVQISLKSPSVVVTVMVVVPRPTAVTLPFSFTVATPVSSLFHSTDLSVSLSGVMVGVKVASTPTFRFRLVLSSDTPVTL